MAKMTRQEIDEFLATPRMAHLATIDAEGEPRIRPVWYLWRDGALLLTSRLHRHTAGDLRAHPRVALSIASEDRPYRAVVAHGTPEILPKERDGLYDLSSRYGEAEARVWVEEVMHEENRVLMRLAPEVLISWDYGKD